MNLFGIIIIVLDIIAIVDCWKGNFDQGKKILWTLLILILPLAGLILYYLLAKKIILGKIFPFSFDLRA